MNMMTIRILLASLSLLPGMANAVDDHDEGYRTPSARSSGSPPTTIAGILLTAPASSSRAATSSRPAMSSRTARRWSRSRSTTRKAGSSPTAPITWPTRPPLAVYDRGEGSRRDLALLRLIAERPETKPIRMASKSASAGQSVFTIGNTGHPGVLFRFAAGHVRLVAWNGINKSVERSRHRPDDGPLNRGDSGGPVDANGELVGMSISGEDVTRIRSAKPWTSPRFGISWERRRRSIRNERYLVPRLRR